MPIVFVESKQGLFLASLVNHAKSFLRFILNRDDGSHEPIYAVGDSTLKMMTVLSEYIATVTHVAKALGFTILSWKAVGSAGAFELQVQGPESLREQVLLRASIAILSCTRGFSYVEVSK